MRIALVHNFHAGDVPSGENEVVAAEAAALARAGIDVQLAAVHNDDLARRPLHALQAAATVATGIGISPRKLLGDFRPDVIHVHSLFPYLGRRWLRHEGTPVVATMHSYRGLCANGYLFRDGHVCTLCVDGRPWSGVRYGCYRDSALATLPLAWAGRNGLATDPLVDRAGALLMLSDRALSVFAGAGVPRDRMVRDWHFLPDALDPGPGTDQFDAWVFVGRLSPEKGIDRLIAEWPDSAHLRVIGDGPLLPVLEAAAAGKHIEFLGRLPRDEVMDQLRKAIGLVFPSLWYETFGLAYMEALAAGAPTLAFAPNVVAEQVASDGTGIVAEWGAVPAAVAEATRSFGDLRERCRSVFLERYTEAAFVARRTRLYRQLIEASPDAVREHRFPA